MWEILDISIPAVVLIPLIAIGVLVWVCLQQNARSSDVRRAEFQRLRRLAMEEHERAERELEQEYMRHKPADSQGGEFPRRRPLGAPGNGYGNDRHVDVGLGEWREPEGEVRRRKLVEEDDHRRRKLVEEDDHRRKHGDAAFNRRRLAEEEEDRRKHAESELFRRRQAAAEELRAETEERKRREADDEIRRKRAEEQDWQRRRAALEAQARREAEEERRRQAAAEEEERQRRWKQEEAQKQEAVNFSPRRAQPSGLTCIVCGKPTGSRRRCSRCKGMNYCSRECQVQHWSDGHKFECRPMDSNASPRSSMDGDSRNLSDFNSPRSTK